MVLLEGHVVATDKALVNDADFAVVFEGSEDICRERRIGRRQRSPEDNVILSDYIKKFVWPAFERYGKPAQEALAAQLGPRRCISVAKDDERAPEEIALSVLEGMEAL